MSPYVREIIKETGKSNDEIQELWDKAIELTAESYGVDRIDFNSDHFNYAKKTVYNLLQKEEYSDAIQKFLDFNSSTKNFIKEYVQSANFSDVLDTAVIHKDDDKDENDDEDEDENDDDDKDDMMENKNKFNSETSQKSNVGKKQYNKEELKQFPVDEIFETQDGIILSVYDPYGKNHYIKASSLEEAKNEGWDV
ncbi:MAG: hypothetical protein ACOC3V_00490 [bacterium]